MLNVFDRLPWKAQYFARDIDAQLPVTYKVCENYIFQQVMRVGASFLPHESGEEPVTRLKSNAKYRVVERHEVLKSKGLTSDQIIEFTGVETSKKCPIKLRRVGYRDEASGKHYVFLTNNFKLCAKTIADIYKARWQVELFFKWIKQNLKIKSFIGTSKNAVLTQIWIAMCVYLLIAFLRFQSKLTKSMQQIIRVLQLNLFEKRDLMSLLRGDPIKQAPPNVYQGSLF